MAKDSLASEAPKPPSFEDILSDLRCSDLQDVAFRQPSEVCPAVKGLIGHSSPTHGEKERASKFITY